MRPVITIRLEAVDPPTGTVSFPGGHPVTFAGWLGLPQVLSELLSRLPASGPADGVRVNSTRAGQRF
jgi:hypothetical protein